MMNVSWADTANVLIPMGLMQRQGGGRSSHTSADKINCVCKYRVVNVNNS